MNQQKYIAKMTGYKATNADLTCQGHQFVLGEWSAIEGEISLCARGFHFCRHPSGPSYYYSDPTARIFKVEAEQVLDLSEEPGADFKLVAKRIRLVEEITPGAKSNRNTGDWNTGDWNTGNLNTGNLNTGNRNTGNLNTGDGNTGNRNTGDWNTGNLNTGDGNTGNGNATNYASGFFCQDEPKIICFDEQTNLSRERFLLEYPEYIELSELLRKPDHIEYSRFKRLPGITPEKLASLHAKHLKAIKP